MALVRHSILYLLFRVLSGIIGLVTIAVLVRLLSAEQYGVYAIVLSIVGLISVFVFRWLDLGMVRFYGKITIQKGQLESTVYKTALWITFVITLSTLVMSNLLHAEVSILLAGGGMLILQGWQEITLQWFRVKGQPVAYGVVRGGRQIVALLGGVLFYYLFGSLFAVLAGILFGGGVVILFSFKKIYKQIDSWPIDRTLLKDVLFYGLPLAYSLLLSTALKMQDRIMLGWLGSTESAGLYAASADFTMQTLMMLMMSVNLAAVPVIHKTINSQGESEAKKLLSRNILLLVAVGFPACCGLFILAPSITNLVLGEEFGVTAASIVPWIAVAGLLLGLKSYYFDLSFQITKRTVAQFYIMIGLVVLNGILNLWLIPEQGIQGAVKATLISAVAALICSGIWGRYYFQLPFPSNDIYKIIMATFTMGCAIALIREYQGLVAVVFQVLTGVLTYTLAIFTLNVADCRAMIRRYFHKN